jgi:hypothetical protein
MQEQGQMMTHFHITLDSPEKRLTELKMATPFDKIWKLRSQTARNLTRISAS